MQIIPSLTLNQTDFITSVIDILNEFHQNIKFIYEVEHNSKISFLDVLLMRCNGKLDTTVFRKETNNDIYVHWGSFAPMTGKKGTWKNYTVQKHVSLSLMVSQSSYQNKHLILLKITTKTITTILITKRTTIRLSDKIVHTVKLPCKGDHGIDLIKSIVTSTKKLFPQKHDVRIITKDTKVCSQFYQR